ncbi:MAG: hypothetical protein ACYC3I_22015 [Gemmataceae bacterium]
MKKSNLHEYAKALSALGAAKGGRARANTLTPEERQEIAKRAAKARWEKAGKAKEKTVNVEQTTNVIGNSEQRERQRQSGEEMPFSMFRGTLKFGDMDIECHVLNDGKRVFTQGEVVRLLTGGTESSNLGLVQSRVTLCRAKHRAVFSAGAYHRTICGENE